MVRTPSNVVMHGVVLLNTFSIVADIGVAEGSTPTLGGTSGIIDLMVHRKIGAAGRLILS